MKHKSLIFIIILILMVAGLSAWLAVSTKNFFTSEEVKGYIRQWQEEKVVDAYIEDLTNDAVETIQAEEYYYQNFELDYEDDRYEVINGVRYTPDYAVGRLDCVLEIPKIKMRRGVYSGTNYEIQQNLDMWLTTAGNQDMVLGKTNYAIYGHNSPTQDLSFNLLKDVEVGDYFILTASDAVYVYDVTDFFAQWRETVTRDYIWNIKLPKEKCYIITCGRGQYRYRDIVVEGTLRKKYSLKEWETAKNDVTAEKVTYTTTKVDTREKLVLSAEVQDTNLVLSLQTPDTKEPCAGALLCIGDSDGLMLKDEKGEDRLFETGADGTVSLPLEDLTPETEYVAGVYDYETKDYRSPDDVQVVVHVDEKRTYTDTENVTNKMIQNDHYIQIWGIILIITGILVIVLIILTVRTILKVLR